MKKVLWHVLCLLIAEMAAIQTCSLGMVFQSKGREVQALDGIDLEVVQGTVFGFLGPNGAGKTTTMHILLGFVQQTEGEAYIFGESVRDSIARQANACIR